MNYIDVKYIRLVSGNLRNFKQKKDNLFNFSCPICGDSKKDLTKARGFIFDNKSSTFYKCFNCGISISFGDFLKKINSYLFDEYSLEKFKNKSSTIFTPVKSKLSYFKFENTSNKKTFDNAEICCFLPKNHKCINYLKSRKIPESVFDRLLYTDNFKNLVIEFDPNTDKELLEESRLIIPIYDKFNCLVGIAGRSLEDNVSERKRYITIKHSDYIGNLIYGIERINLDKPIYVVEGQIDSLFIPNCVAMCHAELDRAIEFFPKENLILIPDNEPRASIQVKKINKFIRNGFSVVLFPPEVIQKDINLMVMNDIDVMNIINKNTFQGIRAELEFNKWKKC